VKSAHKTNEPMHNLLKEL